MADANRPTARGFDSSRGRAARRPAVPCFSIDGEIFRYPEMKNIPHSMRNPNLLKDFKSSVSVIGFYSEDGDKKFSKDASSLKFIDKNQIPDEISKKKYVEFDLKVAEEKTEAFSGTSRQSFLNLLQWIKLEEDLVKAEFGISEDLEEQSCLGPDFVCTKNTLSKIILLPYYFSRDIKFYASSINGTIYLMNDITKDDFWIPDEVSNWSHKFKQYICGDVKEACVMNSDFRVVVKAILSPFTLLYSASTDCALEEEFDKDAMRDLSAFVKLKNTCIPKDDRKSFIRKNLSFLYFNCLLTSTPRAIVGFRDEAIVTLLELFTQEQMLRMCKDEAWHWDPMFAFIYASRLLAFVQSQVESDPGCVFSFTKNTRENWFTSSKEEELNHLLPEWFEGRHEMQ